MSIPVLKRREDIWNNFPVITNPMGRGANGADRHCVEWHNTKVRTLASALGKTEAQMKAEILVQMLQALAASSAWTVEAPAPGSKCVAVIAMKFKARGNNTRKNGNKANKNVGTRRWNRSVSKSSRKASPNKSNNTRKVAKNHSGLSGEAMLRKAKALLNIMSKDTVERLSMEFATLTPKTVGEFEDLIKVITEIAMDQQAYHPLIIHLLHVLDARQPYPEKPSAAVAERILARALEEPIFAKMEVAAEDENAPTNKNIEEKVNLQRRFFRSVMLLTGFLYREDLMPWTSYKRLLTHLASAALETDPAELDYRVFDGYAQGLIFTLIRAGARMVQGGGETAATFASLAAGLRRLSVEAKRGAIRSQAAEFLKSAEEGFKIYEGLPWSVGAPLADLKVRTAMAPAAPAPVAGLGADIAELWRRFPLDVKQEGPVYVVRFHGKKLRERFEKDGKYQTVVDLEATLARHILQLIDASAHWKRGPSMPGTLVTVVKK